MTFLTKLKCRSISGRLRQRVFNRILPADVQTLPGGFLGKAGGVGQVAAGDSRPVFGKTALAAVGLQFTAQGLSFVFIICFGLLRGSTF